MTQELFRGGSSSVINSLRVLKGQFRFLCIIPARKGSKSVREKNLQIINPRNKLTLLGRAIEFAYKSRIFNEICVTTDYKSSLIPKGITLIERPKELATDDAKMADVVSHVLSKIKSEYDYFFLLQPSSPFRRIVHLFDIINLLRKRPASLVSFKAVSSDSHPNRCYTIKNDTAYPLKHTNFQNKQGLMPMWIRNGAYYVCSVSGFRASQDFNMKPCLAYQMPKEESINIDSPEDLILAKDYIKKGIIKDEFR